MSNDVLTRKQFDELYDGDGEGKFNLPGNVTVNIKLEYDECADLSDLGHFANEIPRHDYTFFYLDRATGRWLKSQPKVWKDIFAGLSPAEYIGRSDYKYFIADNHEQIKYAKVDYERMRAYYRQEWDMRIMCCQFLIDKGPYVTTTIQSGWIGHIESDGGDEYHQEVAYEQFSEIADYIDMGDLSPAEWLEQVQELNNVEFKLEEVKTAE